MGGNPTWGYVSECGGHKSLATNKEKINSNKMCNKSEAFLAGPAVCGMEGSDCVTTLHCNYGDTT